MLHLALSHQDHVYLCDTIILKVMATAYPLPSDLSPATVRNTASLLRIIALSLISGAAIASRLFAVVNFESIIHELCVPGHFMLTCIESFVCAVIHGSTS